MPATWSMTSAAAHGSSPRWARQATRSATTRACRSARGTSTSSWSATTPIYRDDDGTEYVVEWVTQQDVDLARRITQIAADHQLEADPASVSDIELGLDTARSATIAPVWAALLTGSAESQGRGSPSDEIRDATGRVPNLWFGDADEHQDTGQRFHVEVYVAPEVAGQRIAAAVAAGGTVVDDSDAPSLTVIADQDGNKGIVCIDASAAKKD